jgi:hypothetical protein
MQCTAHSATQAGKHHSQYKHMYKFYMLIQRPGHVHGISAHSFTAPIPSQYAQAAGPDPRSALMTAQHSIGLEYNKKVPLESFLLCIKVCWCYCAAPCWAAAATGWPECSSDSLSLASGDEAIHCSWEIYFAEGLSWSDCCLWLLLDPKTYSAK